MDDFKRCYSNEDEAKSIPYFFEKFDKENYSIWFGEYKFKEELKKVYMSCNLITGNNTIVLYLITCFMRLVIKCCMSCIINLFGNVPSFGNT